MNYLDSKFNDYKSWIFYYEQKHPYYIYPFLDQEEIMREQLKTMTEIYGENVFDNFYDWLRQNEQHLYEDPFGDSTPTYDMTQMDYTYIYPYYTDKGNKTVMTRFYKFSYDNLYIVIDEARDYLKNYKGKDVSNLKLKLSDKVPVKLYDYQNKEIKCKEDKEFSLEGVKYIKLVGKGTLGYKGKYGLQILY